MPIFIEAFAPPPIVTPPGSCFHHSDFPAPPAAFECPLDVEWLLFDPGAAPPTFLTTVDNPELTPFLPPPGNIVEESFVLPFFPATVVLGVDASLGTLVEGSSESDSDSASDANSASAAVLFLAFVEGLVGAEVG
jgi:hypothetical protein